MGAIGAVSSVNNSITSGVLYAVSRVAGLIATVAKVAVAILIGCAILRAMGFLDNRSVNSAQQDNSALPDDALPDDAAYKSALSKAHSAAVTILGCQRPKRAQYEEYVTAVTRMEEIAEESKKSLEMLGGLLAIGKQHSDCKTIIATELAKPIPEKKASAAERELLGNLKSLLKESNRLYAAVSASYDIGHVDVEKACQEAINEIQVSAIAFRDSGFAVAQYREYVGKVDIALALPNIEECPMEAVCERHGQVINAIKKAIEKKKNKKSAALNDEEIEVVIKNAMKDETSYARARFDKAISKKE